MAHEFESGFMLGRPAWHGLADVKSDPPTTVAEILAWAGGVDAEKKPVYVQLESGEYMYVPEYAAVWHPTDNRAFQIAGQNIAIMERREVVEFGLALQDVSAEEFDALSEATGTPPVTVVSAMSLRGDAVFAICMRIGDAIKLADGTSTSNLYLVCQNGNDGTMAFGGQITSIWTECMNTLVAGITGAKSKFSFRHTRNMKSRLDEARKTLNIVSAYRDAYSTTAQQLIDTPMPRATFEDLIRDVYPRKDEGRAPFSEEQYALIGVLESSTTINDAWRDTRWGGLAAVTEWETWLRKLNNTSRDQAERRLESDLWGRGAKNGEAAMRWLTRDLAGVGV